MNTPLFRRDEDVPLLDLCVEIRGHLIEETQLSDWVELTLSFAKMNPRVYVSYEADRLKLKAETLTAVAFLEERIRPSIHLFFERCVWLSVIVRRVW